ncbi:hypothetical protein E2C01_009767 [Portunus trituberculatus]|uniref:Uncharacterized protein n=1 Tax=Portunus trituberculatus TaxID=210409 RepID=A0A5B7D6V2_PORTR|nr:hypothetical protein [Portunus trituberculatus]
MPEDHPPAWHSLKPRGREPSWSPEPPPSPVRGPHGVVPARLRASQETLETTKEWPPPPQDVELGQLAAPPPPRAFMPGTWSPRPEHLPLTAATVAAVRGGDPRSPGALAAASVAGSQVIYDHQPVLGQPAGPAADPPADKAAEQPADPPAGLLADLGADRPAGLDIDRVTARQEATCARWRRRRRAAFPNESLPYPVVQRRLLPPACGRPAHHSLRYA